MREHCTLPFEIKALGDGAEAGTFTGYASVTGIKDLGRDVIERGAFQSTIAESKGLFPLHLDHDLALKARLGHVEAAEDERGLYVKGYFNLEKEIAREAYADLKHAHEAGLPIGMSIGFTLSKKARHVKGVRHITEVKLWEVTLTGFPMNTEALVEAVKAHADVGTSSSDPETKEARTFDEVMLRGGHWQMLDALDSSLYQAIYDNADDEERLAAIALSIDQFRAAYLAWAAEALPLFKAMTPGEIKAFFDAPEEKAGGDDFLIMEIENDGNALLAVLSEIKAVTGSAVA